MTVTVGPAGVLHPAAAAAGALPEPPAAAAGGLLVLLVELLHAAADSTVAAITAKIARGRLVPIDSPSKAAATVRSTSR
jgi:hypothetical protein